MSLTRSSRVGGWHPGEVFPRAAPPCRGARPPQQPPGTVKPQQHHKKADLQLPPVLPGHAPHWAGPTRRAQPVSRAVPNARGSGCPRAPFCPAPWHRPWLPDPAQPHSASCWALWLPSAGSDPHFGLLLAPERQQVLTSSSLQGHPLRSPSSAWASPVTAVTNFPSRGKLEMCGSGAGGDSSHVSATEATVLISGLYSKTTLSPSAWNFGQYLRDAWGAQGSSKYTLPTTERLHLENWCVPVFRANAKQTGLQNNCCLYPS